MLLFPSPALQQDNIVAIFCPQTAQQSAQKHNEGINFFFLKQSYSKVRSGWQCRGRLSAIALLAEAAFSLCRH